jgi:hypothetical protein
VIENIDRLSRNAKWHQGYLLDIFADHDIAVHFSRAFNSEIERAVLGAISEQGMRENLERMTKGTLHKAKSGRITAKRRAYGYMFVDSQGRPPHDPASDYRRDTHYALHPDEAPIMREIFDRICGGETLYEVCNDLNTRGVPTAKSAAAWHTGNVSKMLKNPLYRGEYTANRYYRTTEWSERLQKTVLRTRQRPKEEWVITTVPAIVSPQVWEAAQQALKRNLRTSTRNASVPFLVQGFTRCARCGRAFRTGGSTGPSVNGKRRRYYYYCGSYFLPPILREKLCCRSPYVFRDEIDNLVWQSICDIIANPELITSVLEEQAQSEESKDISNQMAYLERQLSKCDRELDQWDRAYAAEILGIEDYGEKRTATLLRMESLQAERQELQKEVAEAKAIEHQVAIVQEQLAHLRDSGFTVDPSFKLKRRILAMLVKEVTIDSVDMWYRLDGVIDQVYPTDLSGDNGSFAYTSAP